MRIQHKKVIGTLLRFFALLLLIILLFGHRDIPLHELQSKYATAPSLFMPLDGMEVHYRDEGNCQDPTPLVLIHGTGSSLHTFDAWTSQLIPTYRVIRMDLPGYGLTGPFPHRDYSTENYLTFLKHFLDKLAIEHCVLAGNSLGGGIAWQFALAYPHMVDKLVLIDAGGYPSRAKRIPIAFKVATWRPINRIFTFITPRFMAKASLENVYADKSKISKSLVDRYFELNLREGNRQAFIDRIGVQRDTTVYRNISRIQQKTLILWGDQDQLIPVANAYRFQQDLPNDTLVILKNVGHVPMEEDPGQSVNALMTFLNKNK